jgi:competence protein ComEA
MPDPPELPPRPLPPRSVGASVVSWVQWFGLARLVAGAVSVVVVAAGAFWLLRAPAPATEATLPVATGSGPAVTIAPPSTSLAPASSQPSPSEPQASAIVHVAGAVRSPGVYELGPGMRVADAVTSAGGVTDDGDLDGLNLAAPIIDGQRIYVPRLGEVDPASVASGATAASSSPTGSGATLVAGPLDLNAATAAELEALPGVGPATAAAIVDDRVRNGPFASVDDLDRVSGIGPAKLESLRDLVTV